MAGSSTRRWRAPRVRATTSFVFVRTAWSPFGRESRANICPGGSAAISDNTGRPGFGSCALFRLWNLVPPFARLGDVDGSGLFSERRGASAPASVKRLAGSPLGDPAGLTFQNAVFVAALSDDQGHHVSRFREGSLPELTLGEDAGTTRLLSRRFAKATCSRATPRYCFR